MTTLLPWFAIFVGGFVLFLIGKYFQRREGVQTNRQQRDQVGIVDAVSPASDALRNGMPEQRLGAYAHSQQQRQEREIGFRRSQ